jgi:hypothetical protein
MVICALARKGQNQQALSRRGKVMKRLGMISILALIGVLPALAAELPARKPGLWEIKMAVENRNVPGQTLQQCIDASTDQILQSNAGPSSVQSACTKHDVQRSANGITIDSTCTVAGKPTTTHAVITGSLERDEFRLSSLSS